MSDTSKNTIKAEHVVPFTAGLPVGSLNYIPPMFSKREHIAILLMQGFLASGRKETVMPEFPRPIPVERAACILAGRLIAELEKGE